MFQYLAILAELFLISESLGQNELCESCDPASCDPPRNCLAGLVKDSCDCCYVCGRREGERCDHRSLRTEGFGSCGDRLECRLRTDLDEDDPEEASCFCVYNEPLCGSDGKTYENVCQLTEARYRKRNGLRAVSREPCMTAPKITNSPRSTRNSTGGQVALRCEAVGWPVPEIEWHAATQDGNIQLPGNYTGISVQSRSGPGLMEITSWLLFTGLDSEHEGRYSCIASNDIGKAKRSADVYIIP